jgi:hypothetical protein
VSNILLLTSTIRPKRDQPQLSVVDPEERLGDYARALEYQARLLERGVVDRIVYVDNSGYDLRPLATRFPSPAIEWVSFYDLDYDMSYHRGYGEFRLIDHAHRVSGTLADMAPEDRVWKVTGRYIVKNLRTVIALTPGTFDLYCEVRDVWADMGLMAWSRKGYERHIRELWRQFASPMAPELILAQRLRDANASTCEIISSFYWPPFIVGRRGTDGSAFQGPFTPVRFALAAAGKLLELPIRRLARPPRT